MTATTPGPHRTGTRLLSTCALVVALGAGATPAAAAMDEGDPPAPTVSLPPPCRGPALEGLDDGDGSGHLPRPAREPQILEFDWRHADGGTGGPAA